MGSSCSSAQKKKEKDRHNAQGGPSPIGDRRRSTDSLPYGKGGSPPSSRRPSFEPSAAPLPEQAESPTAPHPHKVPVDAALSSVSAGGSSCSPPPGMTGTPVAKDPPSLDTIGLPDLQRLPEQVRPLLLGRIRDVELQPPLQEITLYIAADFYDSVVEREALAERVLPGLRRYAAERGYELNVCDLHWGVPGVGIPDHSLPDLCSQTLERWRTRRRLLTLVVFNDNIGATLLPRTLPKPHFESGMESVPDPADRELFSKWYLLDSVASPMVYVLQPVTVHYPGLAGEDPLDRKEAFLSWKEEADRMISVLAEVLPDGQKQKNLTSVFQDEIKFVVSDDPQEAKRVLWMQRRFTHKPQASSGDKDRQVERSKVQLEDYLPDTQKLVFYVRWREEGLDPKTCDEDERYVAEMCDSLREELRKLVDGLLEEDFLEEANETYRGIEKPLYAELIQQSLACKDLCRDFSGREELLDSLKDYVCGASRRPLVVHGPRGCGKSALAARSVDLCCSWLPAACCVLRLVGASPESATQQQLLRSISEQCCALYGEHPSLASQSVESLDSGLGKLLSKVSELRPLVIMIDGIDQLADYGSSDLQWLPKELPDNVRLIVTTRTESPVFSGIQELLSGEECFLACGQPSPAEARSIVDRSLEAGKRKLSESQQSAVAACLESGCSARLAGLLAFVCSRWPELLPDQPPADADALALRYLAHVESCVGPALLATALGLLAAAKHGLCESETLDLLSCEEHVLDIVCFGEDPGVRRFPAVLWALAKRYLEPFLRTQVLGGRSLTTLSCEAYRTVVGKYLEGRGHHLKTSAQALVDYLFGKWAEGHKKPVSDDEAETRERDRFVLDQPLAFGANPNRRKLEELPYQVLQVSDSIRDAFLFDPTWLLYKFCGSDPYQLLEDLHCHRKKAGPEQPDDRLLEQLVQLSSYALRNDGSQFFSQVYGRLRGQFSNPEVASQYPGVKGIYETARRPPLSCLLPVGVCLREPALLTSPSEESKGAPSDGFPFTGLYVIKGDAAHVVSIHSERNEIVVWDVYAQEAVRKFTGINQPKDVRMVDAYRALVLCNRELKVYHLDRGELLVKLKGVMNQKMAYYGLHSEDYAVALSRNRMYVNMTNLTTGDLETTFKVGEDRFLNSLLVSANGRICVCGDETQKPFPLLVWDLTSRKLVYDLRIPHHEFVTRLSAISDDGHYVVSVCRELHDSSPNFIIVYDLQSGTLFKKWKPESSSCSIAISSQGGCVLNGLENTWVLVWDLSTGARRFTLRGHSAPADQIRMEETGKRCLTYDSRGRDRSVRVWDVTKGECLAVFTPDQDFSCCELTPDGHAVLLGLRGTDVVTTLLLCRESSVEEETPTPHPYGDPQHKHKVFDVSQEG